MSAAPSQQPGPRLVVLMPTWFGDCLMAIPALRALKQHRPDTHLAVQVREPLSPLLEGLPFVDERIPVPVVGRGSSALGAAAQLRGRAFDTAVLLPNSFRAASIAALAMIPRRVGYARDGRGPLLTDRLVPQKIGGSFTPVPTLEYYLSLAYYLGAPRREDDHHMEIVTRPEDDQRAAELLAAAKGRRIVLLNPGAQKPEKRWPADRFAQLAARCTNELGCAVAVTGSPAERDILARVTGAATTAIIDLPKAGMNLRLLKSIVRASALMVTNDTGPRHLAAAAGTPVVTLFGPTTPDWTHIGFDAERQVVAADAGKPESMRNIGVDEVFARCRELLEPPDAPAA